MRPRLRRQFYTVTAEIALSRHEARVAALEYAAAAETGNDVGFAAAGNGSHGSMLQPPQVGVATAGSNVDPTAVDAHRAAARASLELHKIEQSAAHYRVFSKSSRAGPMQNLRPSSTSWRRLTCLRRAPGRGPNCGLLSGLAGGAAHAGVHGLAGGRPRGCGPHIRAALAAPSGISGEAVARQTIQGTCPVKRPRRAIAQ